MNLISLGLLSSQIPAGEASAATLIGTFSGDDVSLSLTISDIPQDYKHLWLTGHLGQTGTNTSFDFWKLKINSGTGITISGETVHESSNTMVGATSIDTNGEVDNWNSAAAYVSSARHFAVDSLFSEYSNTSQSRKGFLNFNYSPNLDTGRAARLMAYHDASAITSLTITTFDFAISSYSKLYLYGIS
jgi:hypothetical protein